MDLDSGVDAMTTERTLSPATVSTNETLDAYDRLLSQEDCLESTAITTDPGQAYEQALES
jgi:hypothetical protein